MEILKSSSRSCPAWYFVDIDGENQRCILGREILKTDVDLEHDQEMIKARSYS
jgi:hypothetical protein